MGTPTTLVLGGDGAEVDWFVGYRPPPEDFQARLEKILRGESTFKTLQTAYAANPKDVAAAFGLALKWMDRDAPSKSAEKLKEVVTLDPDGHAGTYSDPDYKVTAPFTDFAKFYIAQNAVVRRPKPDVSSLRAFIDANPKSKLIMQAYTQMANEYYASGAPKEEAGKFFEEFAGRFPSDPFPVFAWLLRILRDRAPVDKAVELADRLGEMTASNPIDAYNAAMARAYDLAGDKAKAEAAFGKDFMERRVQALARSLLSYGDYWAGKKENLESAEAMADLATKLMPGDAYYLRQAATVSMKAGNEAKALELFGPAWLDKGGSALTDADLLAYANFWLRQSKNLESARTAGERMTALQPKVYFYWSTLGSICEKLGDKAGAIAALEKALELAPQNAKLMIKTRLDALKKGS